ncbi:MAG: alpha/beta hydrolase [Symploca sp. SIO2E6]|nr:alpha/beta hydrolase [Symploca sp. SIO2E6]
MSCLNLLQLLKTQEQLATKMSEGLGANYLAQVPTQLQSKMRSQPFSFVDALIGIKTPKVRHTKGVIFAQPDGVPLSMEIYRPLQVGQYPGIVVLYGGGWQSGSPSNNSEFNRYLAAQGYTVFAIDYRHAPHYQFPAQLDDVQTALAFIQQQAVKYETDVTRLALIGRSAGGLLAMLAAYQQNALPVKAVVSYYGPFNLTQAYQELPKPDPLNVRGVLSDFLGGSPEAVPQQYHLASPASYVTYSLPPTLLVHGSRDPLVPLYWAEDMHNSLQAAGNISALLEIPWGKHSFDAVFKGFGNQLVLYHTERFLAWAFYD